VTRRAYIPRTTLDCVRCAHKSARQASCRRPERRAAGSRICAQELYLYIRPVTFSTTGLHDVQPRGRDAFLAHKLPQHEHQRSQPTSRKDRLDEARQHHGGGRRGDRSGHGRGRDHEVVGGRARSEAGRRGAGDHQIDRGHDREVGLQDTGDRFLARATAVTQANGRSKLRVRSIAAG